MIGEEMRLRSYKKRPMHFGPYPLEKLVRSDVADLANVPQMQAVKMRREENPASLVNAMTDYQATLDAIRDGLVKRERGVIPGDPQERANHLKSFAYYCDDSQVGPCN